MITLTNTGKVAVTISTLAISRANSGDFAKTNNCGPSVSAGANCTIAVTFAPSASGGRASSLSIASSASGSPEIVSFGGNGTGSPDTVSLSPGSLLLQPTCRDGKCHPDCDLGKHRYYGFDHLQLRRQRWQCE